MKTLLSILTLCVLFTVGCATNAPSSGVGASGEKYFMGNYEATFDTSLFSMDKAIRAACTRAKLIPKERRNYAKACEYLYLDVDGTRCTLSTRELKQGGTRISIRIGATGDRITAQALLIAIDEELRSLGAN